MDGVIENTSTDKIIMIDKLCKRILGHPEVLGRIMKGFIKEVENLSLEEIMKLIKGKKNIEHVRNSMNELISKRFVEAISLANNRAKAEMTNMGKLLLRYVSTTK